MGYPPLGTDGGTPQMGTGCRYPPSGLDGVPPPGDWETEPLRVGRYAFCVQAGGLSCKNEQRPGFTNVFVKPLVDSTSFFSAQLSEDTDVAHGGTVVFDLVIANYGSDFIQSGGVYM